MLLVLFSFFFRGFLVCYLSFVVVEALTFETGLCGVRALKWYSFFDRFPFVEPLFIQARMDSPQFDIDGNKYTHHLWLRLELFGLFSVSFEPAVGLPLNPCWEFWGLSDRDLGCLGVVDEFGVRSGLTGYQKERM